jgi:PAS domain S-box-containing protein
MKILVVDDQIENRYLLETLLKGFGHQVVTAVNGKEAFDLLLGDQFQMVISDILMPVMDGFQLCRSVRNDDTLKDILFVVCTATYVEKEDEELALKMGADRFIRKPIEPEKFLEIINRLIRDTEKGEAKNRNRGDKNEKEVFKLYNQRLIHKLEKKMLSLEKEVKERKQAEEALRESEQRYREIFATIGDCLFIADLDGRIIEANPAACRTYGYTREELIGRPAPELITPEYHPVLEEFIKDLKKEGRFFGETVDRRKDGTHMNTEVHGTVIHIKGKKHLLAIIRDVTERKQAQEAMIRTEKMMTIAGLAAGMAHEINNPLAGILQGIQVILGRISPDSPANREAAEECGTTIEAVRAYFENRKLLNFLIAAKDAGERAAIIVENMLNFSRLGESPFIPVDIGELIDNTVALAENEYDLKKKFDFRKINIVRHYTADLPKVPCEAPKIQQVIFNLLKNAAQAMYVSEEPCITLRTKKEGDMVRIDVEDNGPGIPEEVRRRIFEPFFTTKGVGTGTGLGLSVSYFIINENHGGTMEVQANPGHGTTFIIRLPLEMRRKEKVT